MKISEIQKMLNTRAGQMNLQRIKRAALADGQQCDVVSDIDGPRGATYPYDEIPDDGIAKFDLTIARPFRSMKIGYSDKSGAGTIGYISATIAVRDLTDDNANFTLGKFRCVV